ncbi:MAG: phosphate propanoyltransferase [Eubacteriales bacterium]
MQANEKDIAALVRRIVLEMTAAETAAAGASTGATAGSAAGAVQSGTAGAAGSEGLISVGVSNRHIHLTKEHLESLFGAGYQLTPIKDLSQPGQYACKEQLTIIGPSLRPIEHVRVLGPLRAASQVEISMTDAYQLKLNPPVRESGNVRGSAPLTLVGPCGVVNLTEGCIIANRHIHMTPADARRFGVTDGQTVTVEPLHTQRKTRWYEVQIRVHPQFQLEMHVDTDDANAAGLACGAQVQIVKESCHA